jgi:hypothetical protein
VIDKLDLRILAGIALRPAVRELTRPTPYDTYSSRVCPALHYTGRADLRAVGIDAILHMSCRHGDHHHKLEILDAGKKHYSELAETVESVADVDPDSLGTMRIDLTADIHDVSVSWFKSHARFRFKRTNREHGELKYALIGRGQVETITAGSRPNVIRIYNKIAEWKMQFRRMVRKAKRNSEFVEFEKEFGVKETDVLTRVERQCGGNRIPPELGSFGSLVSAPEFNPFVSVEIIDGKGPSAPSPDEYEGLQYFTGTGLARYADEHGMQALRTFLNRKTSGNAARTLERYRPFFFERSEERITEQEIYEAYRASTLQQLSV